MHKLVLLRHGESVWNRENRFTGWTDVDLSPAGVQEARQAGAMLRESGYGFDWAFTSVLKRAIRTLWIVLEELDQMWTPVRRDWRLNERHYGALQGLNKAETADQYGEEQVKAWRRSYDVPPPALEEDDTRFPGNDPAYAFVERALLPRSESLKDTVKRVLPCWDDLIVPEVVAGKRTIIVAHGNSLRALVKHLDAMSDADIVDLNIPTGIPLVYELDERLHPLEHYYLGDAELIQERVAAAGRIPQPPA